MYVIVAYHPGRPPAVYGPVEDRHPPTAHEPHSILVRVPLHPATTRLGTTPAAPATEPGGRLHMVRTGKRLASAIAAASPPPGNLTPVVLLLASPTSGLLTAIGPFTTATRATTWLHTGGHPGSDITATAFPLHTPQTRPNPTDQKEGRPA